MRIQHLFFATTAALLSSACINVDKESHHHSERKADAHAIIEGRSGSNMSGKAEFFAVQGGVEIRVHVENTPPGWHAVHIHQTGDCSADDGTSAGGHFNPDGVDHGSPHAAVHHAGDLGNMWVDQDGIGHHVVFMPELSISEGTHAVRGRGMIVHAGADDLTTQPTGAAGGRIGCGVIL